MQQLLGSASGSLITISSLLVSLGVGLLLSLVLGWHFVRFGSSLSGRQDLARTFPLILLTTILIVAVVKSSLALSLGLVGALSIVRFRTPIKDAEELAYLFIAIALGVSLGAEQIVATVVATAVILVSTALLSRHRTGGARKGVYIVVDWKQGDSDEVTVLERMTKVIHFHGSHGDLRRLDGRAGSFEATYSIRDIDSKDIPKLMRDLRQTTTEVGVTVLDQRQFPGLE